MQISFCGGKNIAPTILNKQISAQNPLSADNNKDNVKGENYAPQRIYAHNLNALGVNFKGKNDDDKSIQDLNDEYNWYVNNDKTRPLDAFLKIKTNKEKMNELFCEILNDETRSYKLIDDIAGRAREAKKNYETLQSLLGKSSENLLFFLPQNPYSKAFEAYMDERVKNAKSVDELIKLRPDWRESVLVDKYKELTGSENLKIGKIPEDFSNGEFEQICDYLKNYNQFSNFKRETHIPSLTIGNKTFDFEYFTQGKTDKNVYGVYVGDKKYVFKMANENSKSLNNPYSLGVLALIDGYLTQNKCRNIAPLFYYDHDRNTSIYQYQTHNAVHKKLDNPIIINHFMPDFQALGMCYNDTIGNDNYFLSDQCCVDDYRQHGYFQDVPEKELISVDNDHVTFSSSFMLPVSKYNVMLPNEMQHAF